VKWPGDHKFLLKAEKGWFLPILWIPILFENFLKLLYDPSNPTHFYPWCH
jgi:hypothetical protein